MEYIEKPNSSEFISQKPSEAWAQCPRCANKIEQGCQVCTHCKYRMTATDLQPVDHTIRNNFLWFAIVGIGASGLIIGVAASLLY